MPATLLRDDAIVINVASFDNLDVDELKQLKPGVRLVRRVGKVGPAIASNLCSPHAARRQCQTAAGVMLSPLPWPWQVTVSMLERNLLRLYDNFHSPDAQQRDLHAASMAETPQAQAEPLALPWRTLLLGMGAGLLLGLALARPARPA